MKNQKPILISFLFGAFTVALLLVNAALTAAFSFTYLPAAFGDPNGAFAPYLAAVYGLLLMDIGFIAWFSVFKRMAETKTQRAVSILMAVLSLAASIMATLTQLAISSFGLVDLTAYHDGIGMTALILMLVATAAHIIAFAVFQLKGADEEIRQKTVDLKADMLKDSLDQLENRVSDDAGIIVETLAHFMRREVLAQMGFDENVKAINAPPPRPGLPPGERKQTAVSPGVSHEEKPTRRPSRRDRVVMYRLQKNDGNGWRVEGTYTNLDQARREMDGASEENPDNEYRIVSTDLDAKWGANEDVVLFERMSRPSPQPVAVNGAGPVRPTRGALGG